MGYDVHQRSSHSPRPAYDWGPKSPMESNHFRSKEEAWADLEKTLQRKLEWCAKAVQCQVDIIRDGFDES